MKPNEQTPLDDDTPMDALVVKPLRLTMENQETHKQAQTRIREAAARQRKKMQKAVRTDRRG